MNIAITGAAGNIGSNLLFLLADNFLPQGVKQISLHLVEDKKQFEKLQGLLLELEDCFYPHLKEVKIFEDSEEAFRDCKLFIICGAKSRQPGM